MRTNNNILTRGILSTCVLIIAAMLALGFSSCGEEKPQQEPDSLTTTPEGGLEVETIRLLSYNILEGMKEDKTNNYDNFVAWMNEIDPDIFAIQEANKLTDEILGTLAARFGHQYIQTNICLI